MGTCQTKGRAIMVEGIDPSCRNTMLDINGKSAVKKTDGFKSKKILKDNDSTDHDTRLANIFMSPVKIEENYVFPKFEKSDQNRDFISQVIKDNFIFADVGKEERTRLLDAFENLLAPKGHAIIKEGEVGDFFYVIQSGKVEYTVEGKTVGEAGKGRSFGDLALLYDCPRAATVIAAEECILWRVDQKTFRQILANGRINGDRETIDTLKKVSFLSDLSDEYLAKMAAAATDRSFKKGDVIIRKGDPGTEFYILKEGSVAVKDIEVGGQDFVDQNLRAGEFFGERAIVTDEPRVANIVAIEDCTTLCLSREDFLNIIGPLEKLLKKESDLRDLKSILAFATSDVTSFEYSELAAEITEQSFPVGTSLYTEGEAWVPSIFFVRSGRVKVTSSSKESLNGEVTAGGYFGVDSSIFLLRPSATATVTEDAVLGVLTKNDIEKIIRSSELRLSINPEKKGKELVRLEDLKKHRILGVGTFGKVWLVSRRVDGETQAFALKVQRKRQLIRHSQVEGAIREIKVMANLEHPFVLKLINVYQDDATVMMLLQLVQGGELYGRMKSRKNKVLSMRESKFYAASILEGLHYMHYHRIVHRDLKPENVLIDKDGYAIIVDLGFAKQVHVKTFTLCGTPWYIAPEVILGRGHDKACDYWSWAILVHEMCTGQTPFRDYGANQMTLFKAIIKGKYKISHRADDDLENLMRLILVSRPQYRLGNLAGGTKDIKTHEWLRDVDFNKMANKLFRAPWQPDIVDPLDVEAFDNWDHMEKEGKEKPLNKDEQERFWSINEIDMQ